MRCPGMAGEVSKFGRAGQAEKTEKAQEEGVTMTDERGPVRLDDENAPVTAADWIICPICGAVMCNDPVCVTLIALEKEWGID